MTRRKWQTGKNLPQRDAARFKSKLPFPRYDKLNLKYYGPFRTFSVQTSWGLPFKWNFCSERFYLGEKFRCRPVKDVVEEIKHTGSRRIFFADGNFSGNKQRAMQLMEAIIPLKVRWSNFWSLYLCEDKEFMDIAQQTVCCISISEWKISCPIRLRR